MSAAVKCLPIDSARAASFVAAFDLDFNYLSGPAREALVEVMAQRRFYSKLAEADRLAVAGSVAAITLAPEFVGKELVFHRLACQIPGEEARVESSTGINEGESVEDQKSKLISEVEASMRRAACISGADFVALTRVGLADYSPKDRIIAIGRGLNYRLNQEPSHLRR